MKDSSITKSYNTNKKNEDSIISLYVSPNLTKEKYLYSSLMYPFWGIQDRKNVVFLEGMFTQYCFDSKYYSITDKLISADYVFIPYNYQPLKKNDPEIIAECITLAKRSKKPLLIDAIGDKMKAISVPNSIVLRYAYYRKKMTERDVIVPVSAEDLLLSHRDGIFTPKEKSEQARVGFVGWSSLPFLKYPKTYIKDFPLFILGLFTVYFDMYRKGALLRQKILKKIENSKHIETNFIYRISYSGNKNTAQKDPKILREEFVDNILESDYTLCVRGDANQSTRFYEVLSLGRIPVFIDTDIPLPLEDIIDYRSFCIFIDYRDLKNIDKIIYNFHKTVSPEKFKDMQRKARDAYEKYLRTDSYTKYLMQILKNKL